MTHTNALSDHPTRGGVIRWAKFYDRAVGIISMGREAAMRNSTLERANVKPGQRILDVGCGTGTLTIAAARRGATVIGVDPAANMVRRAREKAAAARADATFQVGVAEALEFADDQFDMVLCSLVLHHLLPSMQDDCLREMLRVIKPGGQLVLVDFSGPSPLLHRVAALFRSHDHEHLDGLSHRLVDLGFENTDRAPITPSYLFCMTATKPATN